MKEYKAYLDFENIKITYKVYDVKKDLKREG